MDKTFDAGAREREIYRRWEETGAFKAGAGARPGPDGTPPETFCVMIPPPNVTGSLHMGHAFNNTLQDILVRWHRMRGHDTLWQPGQDHAGIATQMVVERELAKDGKRRTDFSREEFVNLVWQQKEKSGGRIIEQLKRLGASCDWSRNAFTMAGAPGDTRTGHESSPDFHDAVLRVFVEWYDKGLIYRGKRLVNWDPQFETAISDLEVENVEVDGHMWHFRYPLAGGETYEYVERDADGTELFRETRDWISIATTRPETMLGDGAVAVHPSDARYAPIVGKLCEIPVGPKEHRRLIPIITDEYPDPAFGSGAVKITGAHDFNDYGVATRGGIPLYRLMDTKARMRDDGVPYAEAAATALAVARGERQLSEAEADALNLVPDELRGLDRYEARERVVAQITAEGLAVMVPETDPRLGRKSAASAAPAGGQQGDPLDAYEQGSTAPEAALVPLVEPKKIMQPFGDRSKVVIEPMLTDQWFVDTKKIVQPALDAVRDGRTTILPERDAKVYFHWLENIEPWCISRQLWWGHQIPVWYVPRYRLEPEGWTQTYDNEPDFANPIAFCAPTWEEAQEKIWAYAQESKINAGFVDGPYDSAERASAEYQVDQYGLLVWRDPDVLDTWFSSGIWPLGTLGWPNETDELKRYFPTDVLVTGFDIIFFWVARMMMMQLELTREVPFETVYVHALVRDEKGKKMSKSLGNVLDPLDLIDQYGADAVRFTLAAMAAMGRDLRLSEERIAGYRNFVTKLWNAARFAEMNGALGANRMHARCTPGARAVHPAATATANRWIIGETARVRAAVDEALGQFRFDAAAGALYAFVWGRVCDWYLELAKPLFDGDKREETQEVMAWVMDQCLRLLHPFMPFVTEDLWRLSGHDDDASLALAEWPNYGPEVADPAADSEMTWVISLIEGIRSARGEVNVPPGARAPLVAVELSDFASEAYERNSILIERLARVDGMTHGAAPKGALTVALEGATFAIPLAGLIDIDAEKARLTKALEKSRKDLGGLRGRLGNPKFVASAPEEVVEETRATLAQKEDEEGRFLAALARLQELA